MRKKRNHSFNWVKRNLRNLGIEYTLSMLGSVDVIYLKHPLFYCLIQDKTNPNYFQISHPDCIGLFEISICHNYNFKTFIEKFLRYEQMFQKQILTRMSLAQKIVLCEKQKLEVTS